jgi:hypothetical protein
LVIFKQKESSVEVTILHGSLRRFPSILYDQIVLDLNNFCLFFLLILFVSYRWFLSDFYYCRYIGMSAWKLLLLKCWPFPCVSVFNWTEWWNLRWA